MGYETKGYEIMDYKIKDYKIKIMKYILSPNNEINKNISE